MVADRLRNNIVSRAVSCQGTKFAITVTLGVAANSDHDISLDKLVEQADRAMCIGKSNGKNQCAIAEY